MSRHDTPFDAVAYAIAHKLEPVHMMPRLNGSGDGECPCGQPYRPRSPWDSAPNVCPPVTMSAEFVSCAACAVALGLRA